MIADPENALEHPYKADAEIEGACAQCGAAEAAHEVLDHDHEVCEDATGRNNAPHPLTLKTAFVEWLFASPAEREHRTMTAWADAHGVARETLWRWRTGDEEVLAMIKEWRKIVEAGWPGIAGTLVRIAQDADHPQVVQAARTVAELLDKYPDKRVKVDHSVTVTGLYAAAAQALTPGDTEPDIIEGEIA